MRNFLPEECPEAGVVIGWALKDVDPAVAQAIVGGTLGNMVGHISDAQWEQMVIESGKQCECGKPSCDHINRRMFKLLDELRMEWKKVVGELHDDSEEKGLSA